MKLFCCSKKIILFFQATIISPLCFFSSKNLSPMNNILMIMSKFNILYYLFLIMYQVIVPSHAYNCSSLEFNNVGTVTYSKVEISDSDQLRLDTGSFTLEAWVYPKHFSSTYPSNVAPIISKRSGGAYQIYIDGSTQKIGYNANDDQYVQEGTTAIPINTWNHIAIVYNSGTGITTMWLNGTLESNKNNNNGNEGNPTSGTSPFLIGFDNANPSYPYYFHGAIADVRVSSDALYQTSFVPLARNKITSLQSTLGLWKLDEGKGSMANDTSAYNNGGVITNGKWVVGLGTCPTEASSSSSTTTTTIAATTAATTTTTATTTATTTTAAATTTATSASTTTANFVTNAPITTISSTTSPPTTSNSVTNAPIITTNLPTSAPTTTNMPTLPQSTTIPLTSAATTVASTTHSLKTTSLTATTTKAARNRTTPDNDTEGTEEELSSGPNCFSNNFNLSLAVAISISIAFVSF